MVPCFRCVFICSQSIFQCPIIIPDKTLAETETSDETLARSMIEKKSAINLLEAYAVSVKHYLRGEDGIYYQYVESLQMSFSFTDEKSHMDRDLYYLVKFLPAYALPAGRPSKTDLTQPDDGPMIKAHLEPPSPQKGSLYHESLPYKRSSASAPDLLPAPVTTTRFSEKKTTFLEPDPSSHKQLRMSHDSRFREKEQVILSTEDENFLFPAYMPPKYHLFDLFPFSLLVGTLTARGKEVKGKKAAKIRAQMRKNSISHNLPHEISLYLVSWASPASEWRCALLN